MNLILTIAHNHQRDRSRIVQQTIKDPTKLVELIRDLDPNDPDIYLSDILKTSNISAEDVLLLMILKPQKQGCFQARRARFPRKSVVFP